MTVHNPDQIDDSLIENDGNTLPTQSLLEDERGVSETVQTVLKIFLAVIILVALLNFFFPQVFEPLKQRINEMLQPRG